MLFENNVENKDFFMNCCVFYVSNFIRGKYAKKLLRLEAVKK